MIKTWIPKVEARKTEKKIKRYPQIMKKLLKSFSSCTPRAIDHTRTENSEYTTEFRCQLWKHEACSVRNQIYLYNIFKPLWFPNYLVHLIFNSLLELILFSQNTHILSVHIYTDNISFDFSNKYYNFSRKMLIINEFIKCKKAVLLTDILQIGDHN